MSTSLPILGQLPPPNGTLAHLDFHFFDSLDVDRCLKLQERLIYESGAYERPRAYVLLVEHPPLITVGRSGSRAGVRLSDDELQRRQLQVRWVARGGGCCLHGPGQLAIYPIVPLHALEWTVGQFMQRFQAGMAGVLQELSIPVQPPGGAGNAAAGGSYCLAGRTGPLVVFGAAVRYGVTCHGAFCNVVPQPAPFGYIDVLPAVAALEGKTTQSSLLAERGRAIKMPLVRSLLVEQLARAFGAEEQHVHSGHVLLEKEQTPVGKRRG